jgi:predicted permease
MTILQDIGFTFRVMRKSPRLVIIILLTLAVGIGSNTAIFSIVNATLLRPLPFPDPDQLVQLRADLRGVGAENVGFSMPEVEDLRERADIFQAISPVWQAPGNFTGGDHPERLEILAASPNYFSILGAQPQIGRLFDSRDNAEGFAEAAVISDDLWQRDFGRDGHVLGRRIRLDNDLYTVVGVLPPGFRHPASTSSAPVDVWVTAGFKAAPFPPPQRNAPFLPGIIGRLKPGMNVKQAQTRLTALSASLRQTYGSDYPPSTGWTLSLVPLKEIVVGNSKSLLISLLGAVGLILLIACVNVANLLLANASQRRREMMIRMALGASRRRIIQQMLTECALLSVAAAIVGVGTAAITQKSLVSLLPSQLPRMNAIQIDGRVLAFSLIAAIGTTLLFGLLPALHVSKDASDTTDLRSRGSSKTVNDARIRKFLIGAELALSLMLLVASGLLLQTFWGLLHVDPGFNSSHLVASTIWLPVPNDPKTDIYASGNQRTTFIRESLTRLRTIPGVEDVAISSVIPLQRPLVPRGFRVDGVTATDPFPGVYVSITPDFFRTLGATLLSGRTIAESDDSRSQDVVVIDQSAARRFWGDQNPIGRRIRFARDAVIQGKVYPAPWMVVVGLVHDVKMARLDEGDVPHIYASAYQSSGKLFGVIVRGQGDTETLGHAIRAQVQAIDSNLPISDATAMTEVVGAAVGDRRFAAWLLGAFACVAVLLASIGVYGVASYTITTRNRELGIRSALGATPRQLTQMMLRDGMIPVIGGLLLGFVGAALSGRLISTMLFGVHAIDFGVYSTAGVTLVLIALGANYFPARRAGRVDPIIVLRDE